MRFLFVPVLFLPFFLLGQPNQVIRFSSRVLAGNREIRVALPPHYRERRDSLHLLILLDGNNESLFNLTVAAKRFLETNAVDLGDFNAPPSLVVGVEQKDRANDFIDHADTFLQFLTAELLPYLNKRYRLLPFTVLIGHSLGGRFAIEALLKRPDLFNAVITASPAFPQPWSSSIQAKLERLFNDTSRKEHAWFFSTSYLPDDNTEAQFRGFAESMRTYGLAKRLPRLATGFDSSSTLGHAKTPLFTIPAGLHFVYDPAKWYLTTERRRQAFQGGAMEILGRHSDSVFLRWGVGFRDERWSLLIAYQFLSMGQKEKAIATLLESLDRQPFAPDSYRLLLQLFKETNDPRSASFPAAYRRRTKSWGHSS